MVPVYHRLLILSQCSWYLLSSICSSSQRDDWLQSRHILQRNRGLWHEGVSCIEAPWSSWESHQGLTAHIRAADKAWAGQGWPPHPSHSKAAPTEHGNKKCRDQSKQRKHGVVIHMTVCTGGHAQLEGTHKDWVQLLGRQRSNHLPSHCLTVDCFKYIQFLECKLMQKR